MKYFTSILTLMLLATTSNAQLTFTSDDFLGAFSHPTSGTSFSSADLTGLDALIAMNGAAMSWDFGNRVYTQDAAPTVTSTLLAFPGGAALANDPDFVGSTHVFKSVPSDPMQPTTYLFIKFDQTGYWWLGSSQDSMGVAKKVFGYVPPEQQMKFPLTYQTSWQSTSNVHSPDLPDGATYSTSIDASVDAYGTLITPTSAHKGSASPMASSDVLRVKTKNTTTLSISLPGFTYSTVTVNYTFQYYTKTGRSATIGADTNVKATSVHYSTQGSGSSVSYNSSENSLNLYLSANPASNSDTKLYFTPKTAGNAQISIMDALGKEVRILHNGPSQAGQNMIPLDPAKLSAGTYFIRINIDGITATRKLIITK